MSRAIRLATLGLAAIGVFAVAAEPDGTPDAGDAPVLLAQAPQQQPPTPEQRVAMLKQWLQASQVQLRAYEWIETTTIAKDGEEKSRTQSQNYYGADGTLQKVPIAAPSSAESGGGPPGILPPGRMIKRAAGKKKEDLQEYMQNAAALAHAYVPPDPNRLQGVINGGKFSMNMVEPGRRVRLEFRDYQKTGDLLSIDIEVPTNRLLGMNVSSYLDSPKDPVQLDVFTGVLPDGTIYTAKTNLNAQAEGTLVTIENTGHRRTGQ